MRGRRQRGSAVIEFALAGVATIFLIICAFHIAMAMWNYHTLADTVHEATRYVAVKGVNCTKPGNSCSVTVGTIATKISWIAIGLPKEEVNVKLTTDSGAVTDCSPLSSCFTNTSVWPPGSNTDNAVGKKITVSATYQFTSPLVFFWPGVGGQKLGQVSLPASSTQTILF
jgi:hypothetical protein